MPRSKKTASNRQRQSDDVVYIEPPPEHQFARFFSRFDDLNHYVFNFHERKKISPRYLDIKILEIQNFNVLHSILTSQGLIDFVQIKESYYPELVAIAYSTLSIEFNEECPTEFTLRVRLLKNEYEIDSGTLSTIWGFDDLDTSNCVLFDGNKTPESWGPHVKRQAFEMFNIQRVHKSDHSKGIGYVCLWTRIFKHLGIDFSNESGRMLAQQHVIDIRELHHMGTEGKPLDDEAMRPRREARVARRQPRIRPQGSLERIGIDVRAERKREREQWDDEARERNGKQWWRNVRPQGA
ncbi:hypothetical protein PIB30_075274 [Stylosanthes scabra]|uniref:Uncharacterized protein n=1 Tax=Stylosanthes scabra TaxID=79078 RepID=A0ABU6WRI6_9FABA|nr:hypothetical protein [Stylosanthes scabra]